MVELSDLVEGFHIAIGIFTFRILEIVVKFVSSSLFGHPVVGLAFRHSYYDWMSSA